MPQNWAISPIGVMRTPFKEKFGIPRQSGAAPHAWGRLELNPPFDRAEMWKVLQGHPLVWITFIFHQAVEEGWKDSVRPPRLGGKERLGTFATRSPHRPNFLGLSLLEIERFEETQGRVTLHLKGVDLLDGTPVVDVRPYLPEIEARSISALAPFAGARREPLPVRISEGAQNFLNLEQHKYPHFRELLEEILGADQRPAFQHGQENTYAMRLEDFDVDWHVEIGTQGECVVVDGLRKLPLKSLHE